MSTFSQARPGVSSCETYHLDLHMQPLYARRFSQVLPFHEPGLAPVSLNGQAWHIKLDGSDAYKARFDRTFGFYCSKAAVVSAEEWFHITPDGNPLYAERYAFAGNFQNNCCVVCNRDGFYFHINLFGQRLYQARWKYCGDYREGVAIVQGDDGMSTHIDMSGQFVHGHWFVDLDVFHKGFARARDAHGWHHVDWNGQPLYSRRYAQVEPFYNGCARVETMDGSLQVINETGAILRELRSARRDHFAELSADMVGYWRTFCLSTAAELALLDHLPSISAHLAKALGADASRLERLLRALAEMDVVAHAGTVWSVTDKGQYLLAAHNKTLRPAAIEYGHDLLDRWRTLPKIIKGAPIAQDIFNTVAADPQRRVQHHHMLASYALHDYPSVVDLLNIQAGDVVFDAAGGSGTLSRILAERYPEAKVICGDIEAVTHTGNSVEQITFDLFSPWPVKANKIVLARVLHDWNDNQAKNILRYARAALMPKGEVLVLEMLLPCEGFAGALCDLHLLAVTGGQERRSSEYEALFEQSGLALRAISTGPHLISILRAGAKNE